MGRKRWLVWVVVVLLLAGAIAGGLAWRARPPAVEVAKARIGPAADLVYATGYVEAQQPVSVAARITAPVAQVLVSEGDRVRRGQPLVLLVDDEQRGLLDQAAAQRRAAEETERRTVTLYRQGWMTRAARDQAVASADAARAGERTAVARRDQLVVRANTDGVVTKRDVEPGDLATPTRVLILLGDPARIRITATVDERDITRVRVGQDALMSSDAWPGRVIHARVHEVTPSGDPNARAFRVRLLPESAGDLPLGITLEVNVVTRSTQRAVLVPATAFSGDRLWVVTDGQVHARTIRRGIEANDMVEILSGLRAGETVVVAPPADLAEGRKVRIKTP